MKKFISTLVYFIVLLVIVFTYCAIPFVSIPALAQVLWTSGFAESFANAGWPAIKAVNFGFPGEAPIAFGLAGAILQSTFIALFGMHAADAYALGAIVWLALSLWGAIKFCQLLGASFNIGAFLSLMYLTLPVVWFHAHYSMLSFAFALMPFYLYLAFRVIYFLPEPGFFSQRWWITIVAYILISTLSAFMDGYTFIMFFAATGVIWLIAFVKKDVSRKALFTLSLPTILLSAAFSYFLYTIYLGASEFQTDPMSHFRGFGVDIIMLLIPSQGVSWLWDLLGWSVLRSSNEFFGDSSVWMTTFALPLILIGGVGFYLAKKHRFALPLLLVSIMGLYFSLGPSLKINSFRPVDANGEYLVQGTLMPEEYAVAPTGSAWIFEHVPGFKNMRAPYRWSGLMFVGLFGLAVLFYLETKSRGHMIVSFCVVSLLILSNFPNLTERFIQSQKYREMMYKIDADFSSLSNYIGQDSIVLFAPLGNDFMVNYLASTGNYRTFNVGGDKNVRLARRNWPPLILSFPWMDNGQCFDYDVSQILQTGLADFVVIPYFDLFTGTLSWPVSDDDLESRRETFTSTISYFKNNPTFSVKEDRLYGAISLSPDVNKIEALNGYMTRFGQFIPISSSNCDLRLLLKDGWYEVEEQYVWGSGNAELSIILPDDCRNKTDCSLLLSFNVFDASSKSVLVDVNGIQVAEWLITSGELQERIIPVSFSDNSKQISIVIHVPGAKSPQELGISNDPRELGIGLFGLELVDGNAIKSDK